MKYIACLLIFVASAFSQNIDSTVQALGNRAYSLADRKQYKEAIAVYNEILALPCSSSDRAQIQYLLGSALAQSHEPDRAFACLDSAINGGDINYVGLRCSPDLAPLRSGFPERFNTLVTRATDSFNAQRLAQSPIAITAYDNYTGSADIANYAWDDYHNTKMDSLRKKYDLLKIAEPGKTEFDRMKLILDWASRRFEHHNSNQCKGGDVLAILDQGEKGAQFCCTEYARVVAGCLEAIGYPARTIRLTWLGCAFGNPDAHMCAESWSNQYRKWILFDGQNDAWWESHGKPLSAKECRQLYVAGRDSEITFVGQKSDMNYAGEKPYWESHFYHLNFGNFYALFEPSANVKRKNFELIADGIVPELFATNVPNSPPLSSDMELAYPQLNQTNIQLRHVNFSKPSDSLNVVLTHTMPWFDKFLVRIDGGEWKESNNNFIWVLNKGGNVIEAKAVNQAGIEGNTSRIALRDNIKLTP